MPGGAEILLADDERAVREALRGLLESRGYVVRVASDGRQALALYRARRPDLLILDLGLPDMDGMQLITEVRSWSQLPILVVSARSHEQDKVFALDAGADDYLTKPFGTSELLARIRTALRHSHASGSSANHTGGTLTVGELTVDYDKRRVYVNGEDARLTQNEYKIVALLSRHAGKVLTYDAIIKELWGPSAGGNNQILRVNMANIRRKIEKNPTTPEYIFTEIGVGYRMLDCD